LPALIAGAAERAAGRFLEFFTVNIFFAVNIRNQPAQSMGFGGARPNPASPVLQFLQWFGFRPKTHDF
jgi:hypothetical protein